MKREEDDPEIDDQKEDDPDVNLRLEHGNLQIIVKLANIYLKPEQPDHKGGSWHVEGQVNESM